TITMGTITMGTITMGTITMGTITMVDDTRLDVSVPPWFGETMVKRKGSGIFAVATGRAIRTVDCRSRVTRGNSRVFLVDKLPHVPEDHACHPSILDNNAPFCVHTAVGFPVRGHARKKGHENLFAGIFSWPRKEQLNVTKSFDRSR